MKRHLRIFCGHDVLELDSFYTVYMYPSCLISSLESISWIWQQPKIARFTKIICLLALLSSSLERLSITVVVGSLLHLLEYYSRTTKVTKREIESISSPISFAITNNKHIIIVPLSTSFTGSLRWVLSAIASLMNQVREYSTFLCRGLWTFHLPHRARDLSQTSDWNQRKRIMDML